MPEPGLPSDGEITTLLRALDAGEGAANDRLFTLVYDELRRIARRQRKDGASHTLTTTALVHETYLKLSLHRRWSARDHSHFFALAARAMRQIVVDHARERTRVKRGGGRAPVDLDTDQAASLGAPAAEILAVDQALERLQAADPELARLVEWRFFGGLSVEEIANALGVSERTVKRHWRAARAFLAEELA